MKKNLSLYLLLQSTTTKDPQYKLLVNDVEFNQPAHIVQVGDYKQQHQYHIDVESLHNIQIVFFGKEAHDTQVDSQGNVVEDLFLVIEKFAISDIDFLPKLPKISKYESNNKRIYNTFNYMSFNGTLTIKIHKNILYTDWLSSIM